jgi:hypothetical protein
MHIAPKHTHNKEKDGVHVQAHSHLNQVKVIVALGQNLTWRWNMKRQIGIRS